MPLLYTRKYYQYILNFINFVKSPNSSIESSAGDRDKIAESVTLFLVKFLFAILVASIVGVFYEPQNLTDKSMSDRFSPLAYLLVGGMVLPLFEETLFRLSLVFRPIYLALSSACFGYYLCTKLVFDSRLSLIDDTFIYRIGTGILLGCLILAILGNQNMKSRIRGVWSTKFNVIYYSSAVVFAWLHLLNFELNYINILLTPILTLPQLFSGLVSGYLRLKFGFLYPLYFHVLTNSILIGISILVE